MAEPFTSHDGVDPQGVRAEVHVETGTGIVEKIERSGTSDNYQVKMRCEKLKHPVAGWLRSDDPLFAKAQELLANGREVAYRIEAKRKPGVDRKTPIAELRKDMDTARDNTVKVMAGLDGMLAAEALTNPAEDQASGTYSANGPQVTPAAAPAPAGVGLSLDAALHGLVTAREAGLPPTVVDACAALALAAGATAAQVQSVGINTDQGERPVVRRTHAVEGKAWDQFNSDGRVNLGSYLAHAALSAVDKAHDLLTERHARIAASTGAEQGVPADAQVAGVAKLLLDFADRVQVGAYDGGKPERGANSHTRCRGLVYAAIDRFPIPIRNADEEIETFREREMAWREQIVAEALGRWKIAFAVMGSAEVSAPATAPAAPLTVVRVAPVPAQEQAAPAASAAPALTVVQNTAAPVFNPNEISFTTTVAHLVDGQPGYQAPTEQALAMLGSMAGHPDVSDQRTVGSLLLVTLGQKLGRQNHGPALDELISHYRSLGEDGPLTFAKDAMLAHGQVTAQAS